MSKNDLLVVGIEGAMRTHPLPQINNFKLVSWEDKETIQKADVYIQANIKENKHRHLEHIYQFIEDSKKPYIVVESAVFRKGMPKPPHRYAYHRFSWWSYFRDEGNYNNHNCPPDRWLQIQKDQNIEIKDWRLKGDKILLLLQRPGDSSLKNLLKKYGSYETFITKVVKQIRDYTDRPIKIRLHPLKQKRQLDILKKLNLKGIEISTNTKGSKPLDGGKGLYEDFADARVVVGFNSNALTESVCEGIPTFSLCPSSMAWDCSNKKIEEIESPKFYDRDQWLYNLGYCQWREDEIKKGYPWFHLKKIYNQL